MNKGKQANGKIWKSERKLSLVFILEKKNTFIRTHKITIFRGPENCFLSIWKRKWFKYIKNIN